MVKLDKIVKSGIYVESDNLPAGFCLLSLRIAIKSYFETLDSLGRGFANPINPKSNKKIDINNQPNYYMKAGETILHFHHFFELLLKDILRNVHPLLANASYDDDTIFYELILNKEISLEKQSNIKTLEFDRTIKRFYRLLDNKYFDSSYSFFGKHRETFEKLNVLRNKIWHRGLFIIDYESLDLFVGQYIFPLLEEVSQKTNYLNDAKIWKYSLPNCNLDPIKEIVEELKSDNYDKICVGLLKEIGRASYENPLKNDDFYLTVDYENTVIADMSAKFQSQYYAAPIIRICPVCGKKTLLIKNLIDGYSLFGDGPKVEYEASCALCGFSISNRFLVPNRFRDNIKIWE